MRQKIVIFTLLMLLGAVPAVANLTVAFEELLPMESVPERVVFCAGEEADLGESLDSIRELYVKERLLDAEDQLVSMEIQDPEIEYEPDFQLMKAEVYYLLGVKNPLLQIEKAKPIYSRLLYRQTENVNEPLILYRLATILKRQLFIPEAEGTYAHLLEKYPETVPGKNARMGLAYCYFIQGKYHLSMMLLKDIQSDPTCALYHPQAKAIEAQINYKSRKITRALEMFKEAEEGGLQENHLSTEGLFYYAETLLENGKMEEGYRLHKHILERPEAGEFTAGSLLRLGDYEISIGEIDKGLRRYETLIQEYLDSEPGCLAAIRLGDMRAKSFPDSLDSQVIDSYKKVAFSLAPAAIANVALDRLSTYYLAGGDYKKAMSVASDMIRANPKKELEKSGRNTLKKAFSGFLAHGKKSGRLADICSLFEQYRQELIDSQPDHRMVTAMFEIFHQRLQYDSMFNLAGQDYLLDNYLPTARYYAGLALYKQGKERDAAELLVWVAQQSEMPEKAAALELVAEIQIRNNDYLGNLDTLQQLVALKSLTPSRKITCYLELGRRNRELARYAEAEKWFAKALTDLDPSKGNGSAQDLADAVFDMADISFRQKKYPQAKKYYEAALGGFREDVRVPIANLRLAKIGAEPDVAPDQGPGMDKADAYWKWLVKKLNDQNLWQEKLAKYEG